MAPAFGADNPFTWIVGVVIAIGLGALLGAFNGFLGRLWRYSILHRHPWRLIVYNGAAWW